MLRSSSLFCFHQAHTALSANEAREQGTLERHDLVMCILITVISLRSCIWDIVQLVQRGNTFG